ncbi:MAG TPA: trypco2 family protein [Streptomyces sp.]
MSLEGTALAERGVLMAETERVELAQMISALRRSLAQAQQDGETTGGPRFRVEGIELETTVQVTKEAGGAGGVRFWLVSAAAGAGRSRGTTQRMQIRLNVEGSALISDRGGEFRELP